MNFAPRLLYPNGPRCLLILFDLEHPGTEERLRREEGAWCGSARVEQLAEGRAVLIIRPGGAARLAS